MGNCLFGGGLGSEQQTHRESIKVIRYNGGIMELAAPVAAESITKEFPGHGLFRSHDLFWTPLSPHDELAGGESYYLLPLDSDGTTSDPIVRTGHVRSSSIPAANVAAPYRMSVDYQGVLKRSYTDVFSRYKNGGRMWKVKLVISPEMLGEILLQERRTEELIESVRTVAKCGTTTTRSEVSSQVVGFSDQWSLSSCRNGSSMTDGLVVDI